jgi:hypothetical protein
MEEAMGMPFWMGCCCMYPCAARNAMRYHYRIRNDEGECCEDGCVPFAVVTFTHCLPPVSQWLVAVYWTIFVMQMLAESKARARPNQPPRYIAGYTKPQLVGFDPSMGVIQLQPKF